MDNSGATPTLRQCGLMTHTNLTPTVLSCSTSSEFLATLPMLLGYRPHNSIVTTFFEGNRARCAARIDLPPHDVPLESTGVDRTITGLVSKFPWAHDVAIVVYTDERFELADAAPHTFLAMWLERALEMSGIAVRELTCVAADGWAEYRSPDARGQGRDLEEIHNHHERFARQAPHSPKPKDLHEFGALPTPDPVIASQVVAELSDHSPVSLEHFTTEMFTDLIEACVVALDSPLDATVVSVCATLIRATQQMQSWLIPVMLIAADFEDPLQPLSSDTTKSFLELLRDPLLTPEGGGEAISQRLLMFSAERLDPHRLRTLINTLTVLAAHTPRADSPGLLALAAWAWWMGGMTTPASSLLDQARSIDPRHSVVQTVGNLCQSGSPLWVFAEN